GKPNGTDLLGFIQSAAQTLQACPATTTRELVILTDGVHQTRALDLARHSLTDDDINRIIGDLKSSGRMPTLTGVRLWFVTPPTVQEGFFTSDQLLRVAAFWRQFAKAAGGDLRSYGPVLVNFGGQQ